MAVVVSLLRAAALCTGLAVIALPAMAVDNWVEGSFDVGGHSLYARCIGKGAPTIVYLHGDNGNADSSSEVPRLIAPTHRICVYSRANTYGSDKVPGPITGAMIVADLHNLLAALDEPPPYVLLGASLGGLVAYQYLKAYPDEVAAMLLLDAAFPDELGLEHFFPEGDRLTHEEWKKSPEQLDYLGLYESTAALRGNEPKIPVTYLLADPSTWTGVSPEYDAVIMETLNAYVASFSPGVIKTVRSEHWMEHGNAEAVAKELEALIASLPKQ